MTCGAILFTGPITKLTTPTVVGVYIGMDTLAVGGIELCASSTSYIDFTMTSSDYRGRMLDNISEASFKWLVGASSGATPNIKLLPKWSSCKRHFSFK